MTEDTTACLADLARSITPEALIHAFLHDPPDKALSIQGHQSRAARYISAILGDTNVDSIKADAALPDQLAAIVERLAMPTPGTNFERAVGPSNGRLWVRHPLGGDGRDVQVPQIDEAQLAAQIADLCSGMENRRALFRLLWRALPERLPHYALLPADTRVPDHTIWNHADTVAAFAAAVQATGHGAHGLLSFAISPVQSFIAAARSLRDLRNGSLLLSWLAFRAMLPILENLAPTALIFPSLRGNAMVDQWLRSDAGGLGSKITQPTADRLLAPSLPNRFLALVPMGPDDTWATALAEAVEAAASCAWREVSEAVRLTLAAKIPSQFAGWDARWQMQIDQTWDFSVSVLPLRELGTDEKLAEFRGHKNFGEAFKDAQKARDLANRIPDRPGYAQESAGRWQASVELAARMLEASRTVRRVPLTEWSDRDVPAKCSLLGTWEQMGPANREKAKEFWGHVKLRDGEAFCAVALVKRFAMEAFLEKELGLEKGATRFADTATVAARLWLDKAEAFKTVTGHNWNGQWLHWAKPDQEEEACPPEIWGAIIEARRADPPPAYYAVLALDGDHMGDWLAGKRSPKLREAIHPTLLKYFEKLANTAEGLEAQRPVTPSLHAAISEALGNFAQFVVPHIVAHHHGELVYAGGDDVLALLPTETVLACADDLNRAFRSDPTGYYHLDGKDLLMMGPNATVSAGVAVVHYKEDLRAALEMARAAERRAKDAGRDALSLTVARRSGEHANVVLPWGLAEPLAKAVGLFKQASDRWAYRMRQLLPVFAEGGPPEEAFLAELRRQLARGDDPETRNLPVIDFYNRLRGRSPHEAWTRTAERLVILWQSASFLARGRDVAGRT
jgi:CRISPR-associated protein Cmr2